MLLPSGACHLFQVKVVGDQTGAYAGNQFHKPRAPGGGVPSTPFLPMQVREGLRRSLRYAKKGSSAKE